MINHKIEDWYNPLDWVRHRGISRANVEEWLPELRKRHVGDNASQVESTREKKGEIR